MVDEHCFSLEAISDFFPKTGIVICYLSERLRGLHYRAPQYKLQPESDDEMDLDGSGRNVLIKNLRLQTRVSPLKRHPKNSLRKIELMESVTSVKATLRRGTEER